MAEHLVPEEIEQYQRRTLTPAQLLRVDDHIASCASCRSLVARSQPTAEAMHALRVDLCATAGREPEHLDYERLAAYIDGELDAVEREVAESHTAVCASCATAVQELRSFQALIGTRPAREYSPAPDPGGWHRVRRFGFLPPLKPLGLAAGVAMATAFLLFLAVVQPLRRELSRQQRLARDLGPVRAKPTPRVPPSPGPQRHSLTPPTPPRRSPADLQLAAVELRAQVARREQEVRQARRESQRLLHETQQLRQALVRQTHGPPPSVEPHAPPSTRLVLNDHGQQWLKDEHGRLVRVQAPPEAVQLAINQGIQLPPDLALIQRRDGTTRGGSSDRGTITVRAPARIATEEDQPLFTWAPMPEVLSYHIVVTDYGSSGMIVAEGDIAAATLEWRPQTPLPRGRIYEWQVRALRDGAVAARSQPVRFKVVGQEALASIMAARRTGSHLIIGTLCARAGLVEQAEKEFRVLQAANPHSALARQLLQSVRRLPNRKS
jgi:hypothetical protein